jgi:hypothetical protein
MVRYRVSVSALYSFEIDGDRDLVKIVLAGLFRPIDVADFFEARRKVHRKLTCAPGQHVTLTDLRALEHLPQETADAFAALLTAPESRARRLAFVVSPATLVRRQLCRVLAGRDGRCFSDPAEAEAWLIGAADGAAPLEERGMGFDQLVHHPRRSATGR